MRIVDRSRAEADTHVAYGAERGRQWPWRQDDDPDRKGITVRRCDLSAAGEHLSALVREGFLCSQWPGNLGQGPPCTLCGRFYGVGIAIRVDGLTGFIEEKFESWLRLEF